MPPTFWCEHACCVCPANPYHLHLFDPSECLDCCAIEAQEREEHDDNDD